VKRPLVVASVVLLALVACKRHPPPAGASSHVRTLTLPPEAPVDLPDGEGRAEVVASCGACHTLRYIPNQPRLTRKSWQATVDKMRNVFGAPVTPEASPKIVSYLVATHGSE